VVVRFFTSAIIFFNFSHLLTKHGRRRCNLFQNFRIGPSLFESNQIRRTRIRMSKFLRAQAKTHRTRSEIAKKDRPTRTTPNYLSGSSVHFSEEFPSTAAHSVTPRISPTACKEASHQLHLFLLIKILSCCCRLQLVNCTLRTSAAPMNHISV